MNGAEGGEESRSEPLLRRGLGVPWLFAAAYSAVGFSIYFALGVVAARGLGLTPLIFLAAGMLFALTTLSYVEGGAMFRERGGSSTFARHAFNELIAFIAGWAILIDYLIVIALAAISVPHYLEPISPSLGKPGLEIGVAALVIVAVCVLNVLNVTGRGRQRSLALLALADVGLQLAVIVVGVLVVWHPDRLTAQLDLFTSPSFRDVVYSAVVAMLAYAGIEAASDLAPDIDVEPRDLKRIVSLGAIAVPLVYAGMAAIALMAVPVVAGPTGPRRRWADATSRRRCWGWSPPSTPPASPTRCAGWSPWLPPLCCSGRRASRCSASPATSTPWRSTARSPAGWAS